MKSTRRNCEAKNVESCLPYEVFRMEGSNPIKQLFEELFKRLDRVSHMQSAASMRKALCFINGFLFAEDCSVLPYSKREGMDIAAIKTHLKNLKLDDLRTLYHRYHENSTHCKIQVSLSHFNRQMYLIDLLFRKILRSSNLRNGFTSMIFGIAPPRGSQQQKGCSTIASLSTCTSIDSAEIEHLNMSDQWIKTSPSDERRHYFNASEVRSLYVACQTLFEKILFLALFTTGMRIGGFCRAKVYGTITAERKVGSDWFTTEKRAKQMSYPISPDLKTLLQKMIDDMHPSQIKTYLFSCDQSETGHLPTRSAYESFMVVAKRAGVQGRHVHPHTTRHTVAWTLAALGNKAEDIACLIGHESPALTSKVYIAMTRHDVSKRMQMPWLKNEINGKGVDELKQLGEELALAIRGPFGSSDGQTFCKPTVADVEIPPKKRRKHSSAVLATLNRIEASNKELNDRLRNVAPQ